MIGSRIVFGALVAAAIGAQEPPAPPAATPESIAVRGEVRRLEGGAPVAGARVAAATASFGGGGGGRRQRNAAAPAEPRFSAECRTGADGAFVLDLPRGRYQLAVSAPGLETIVQPLRAEPGLAPLRLELARGVAVRGRVVGDDGRPVAGAVLVAPPVAQARSGDDGRFEMEGLPVDDPSVRLIASARGRVGREIALDIAALLRGEPLEVRLSAGRTVRLVVRNESGEPVPGVAVAPRALPGWAGESVEEKPGEFRITALPEAAPIRFDVTATDYPDHLVAIGPAADGAAAVPVAMTRGRGIGVLVRDASGAPAAGAVATLVAADGEEATGVGAEPLRAECDAAGRARFDGLAFGAYRAGVEGRDGSRGLAAFTLAPATREDTDVVVRLSRPAAAGANDPAPTQIAWAGDFDSAFASARAAGRPVFVAVAMDNETANDAIAANHFRDPGLVAVTRRFVPLLSNPNSHAESGPCPRYGAVTCAEHRAIEIRVRTEILRTENIVAPQHLVLAPTGEPIERRLFLLSVGDLASLLLRGLARLDPEAALVLAASRIGASGEALRAAPPGSPERRQALADVAALAAAGDALARVALTVSRLESAAPAEAAAVLDALERPGAREAGDVLLRLLESGEPATRIRAARALAPARTDSPVFEAILERLAIEPDAACRAALAACVGVDLAAARVDGVPSDAGARSRIFFALGLAGAEFATPLLGEELASGDPDRVVRAAVALAHLRTPSARQILEAHLVSGASGRGAAARALGAQGAAASAPVLRRSLADPDPFVRAQSARALGRLRDADSAAALEELAAKDPISLVRVEAAGALRALGRAEGTELLRRLERDPHAGERASEVLASAVPRNG